MSKQSKVSGGCLSNKILENIIQYEVIWENDLIWSNIINCRDYIIIVIKFTDLKRSLSIKFTKKLLCHMFHIT